MKKFLSLLLSVVLFVTLFAACGNSTDDSKPTGTNTAADFKVGAIYIGSQNETSGYTYAHHKGITDAMASLNLSTTTNLIIQDNVPEDDTEVAKAIDTLAGKGCKIIFGISFGYINAMDAAAQKDEYKDIIFSHATGYLSNETNFNNYFGRIYQARYLSGVAAGLKSLEMNNNSIGYVSAYGTQYAETCSGINAFALGVQAVNPDATVYVKELGTWGDEALEKQAAEMLINTYKCGVIAQHCDSAQPQMVAANANVFGCGYNSDMTPNAPTAHLTAPIWNWNVYYALAMKTAMEEPANYMSKVGNYYGGLKEGFVDISPLSENCTAGTKKAVANIKELIISGEWDVFSNTKLSVDKDGNVTKSQAALLDNKDAVVISEDGSTYSVYNTDTKALTAVDGGASAVDGIIKGSMNYFVKGVKEG